MTRNDTAESKFGSETLKTPEGAGESSKLKVETPEAHSSVLPTFPDGGRDAWTVVIGAWIAVFVSFGFLNAFGGNFQAYYKVHQLSTKSESDIAWIGAFQSFCVLFMGSVCGSIFDKFGAGVSHPNISFPHTDEELTPKVSKEFWQFFLAQGLLQGFCFSALFSPAFACINHWFFIHRGLVLGIVTSGAAVGGVIWPIAINRLIENNNVGFGWALRITGFIALILTTISALMVKGRLPKRGGSEFFAFVLAMVECAMINLVIHPVGLFFLLFYLPSYGAIHGFDANMIFYSVSVQNAASFFGRILPGLAADSWGRFNIMIITGFISALLVFASIAAQDTASILVVGALYGFTSGNIVSLQGACVPPLLDDPRKIGIGIGQVASISAVGALLGPPVSGWLITFNGFKSAQIFSGVMLALGTIMFVSSAECIFRGSMIDISCDPDCYTLSSAQK
ncbi:hypothetical protein GYMLUDRAFT_160269 [Collybiopsis luxurians FD-317 M1]|nr:hypothetical protein GYMLUDRAFT_160269 [Collybiopsis luxurians FD-317 M1]